MQSEEKNMSIGALHHLPLEVLDYILSLMSSVTLSRLSATSKAFRAKVDRVARDKLLTLCDSSKELASRWRHCTWLERLRIEETETMFDAKRCENQGIKFAHVEKTRTTVVKLENVGGPKLLLSDVTTADVPLLRWRMKVKSSPILEFGIVPAAAQDMPKALHHVCVATSDDADDVRPLGFYSSATVGSKLAVRLPLMHGSIVELVASKDTLHYMVTNPVNGVEMVRIQQNAMLVTKPYTGPSEFRFEQDVLPGQAFKLAITLWTDAALQVLHVATDEGRRVLQGLCVSAPANNP